MIYRDDDPYYISPELEKEAETAEYIQKLEDALNDIYEMFEDEIDADCDNGVWIANRAMKVCTRIEDAIGKRKAATAASNPKPPIAHDPEEPF